MEEEIKKLEAKRHWTEKDHERYEILVNCLEYLEYLKSSGIDYM